MSQQQLFSGQIFRVQPATSDCTKTVHVGLVDDGGRQHDFLIFDNTSLIESMKKRGFQENYPFFYDSATYNRLVGEATKLVNQRVTIRASFYIIMDISIQE